VIVWNPVPLYRASHGNRGAEIEHRPESHRPYLLRCYDYTGHQHSDVFECINSAKAVARAWLLAGAEEGDD
jgi:hypothetical protein